MSESHPVDIKKHVKTYVTVFVSLMALTLITVAISTLHLSTVNAVIVALCIAGIKGSLVASYFMHLISEKKLIYVTLAFTVFVLLALLFLPTLEVFSRG